VKASVNERYGSPNVLEIRDVPVPSPGRGEIRVAVHATTVGRTDACALRAHPFFVRPVTGWLRPKRTILGLDFAGTVDAVGKGATEFSQGERVFGLTPGGYGAHAEYVCVPAGGAVAPMPPGKRFDEVVVCEGAWYANMYLRAFRLARGQRILIYGASGTIGLAALQLARNPPRRPGFPSRSAVRPRCLKLAPGADPHGVPDLGCGAGLSGWDRRRRVAAP
jgi:NADPH:quinone reductase-like Zn-dependent oxidoreductase